MNELGLRRALVALNYLLHAENDDVDEAKENARTVLNCFAPIKFIPEVEGTSIDEKSATDHHSKALADVYIDGIWQIGLVAELTAQTVLSETKDES